MSDHVLEQLGTTEGPLDPGSAFREQLWSLVDVELRASAPTAPTVVERAGAPVAAPATYDRHRRGALAWVRASRTRTVPVAAALLTLLSLGGALLRRDTGPESEQTVETVDDPSPRPSSTATATVGPLGPPAVVGAPDPAPSPGRVAWANPRAVGAPNVVVVPSVAPPSRPWQIIFGALSANSEDDFDVFTAVAGDDTLPRVLVGGVGFDAHPVLSPDRRLVAWTKNQADHEVRTVWLANANGTDRRPLPLPQCPVQLECDYEWPTFGAHSSQLAFTRRTANSSCTPAERCDEIVVYDLPTGRLTAVAYGNSPDWSTRRNEIVYAGSAGPVPRSACDSGLCYDSEIRIVDLSHPDRPSRRIGDSVGHSPRFSPDGEWIAFERSSGGVGGGGVGAVMRRDGSAERDLPGCRQPNWTPDGRLACVRAVDGGNDVFLLDADDGPARQLTFTPGVNEIQFRLYLL